MLNQVLEKLEEKGYNAEAKIVCKDGVTKTQISLKDKKISPAVYLEDFLSDKAEGIAQEIIDMFKTASLSLPVQDIDDLMKWEKMKGFARLCVQKKTTEDILKYDFLDMEAYVRIIMGDSSFKVTCDMFSTISKTEIFKVAFENSQREYSTSSMFAMLEELMGSDAGDIPDCNMYVLTNKSRCFGASAICDINRLKSIADVYHSNLVILPSSIHECIVVIDDCPDLEVYTNQVECVNQTELSPSDILSNHAYFFNRKTGKIEY